MSETLEGFSGVLFSTIAFTLSGSTRQPDESITWPKNLTDGFENSHFSFSVRPAFSMALLEGFPGVLCHMYDVFVCTSKEHDERLEKVKAPSKRQVLR
jgi:hypothetical protein